MFPMYVLLCVQKYTEALVLLPDWTVPMINRANCHKKNGNWVGVEQDCRSALEINAKEFKAHYFLGQALEQQNFHVEAVSHLTKALEAASEKEDSIKDEIWKELARIKHSAWQQQAATRASERALLRQQLDEMLSESAPPSPPPGPPRDRRCGDRSFWTRTFPSLSRCFRVHVDEGSTASCGPDAMAEADALHKEHTELRKAWDRLFEMAARQDMPRELPNAFTCRLTMDIFREPVCAPSGLSYERTALFEHLQKVGRFDPVTRTPCTPRKVIHNLALKDATQQYLEEHPWGWKEFL
eukprot:evm.model.scf_1194EXC.4 EVM.evm.TU.scf_1194EXC.4   scf_1194EXC:20073-25132(-)